MEEKENAPMITDGSLGIFTVVALILMLWGYLWFRGTGALMQAQTINVIFHEVAQLNDNAEVYLDGMRVGIIEKMDWQSNHKVLVRLRITTKQVRIPHGATFMILTNGIVGAKYIEIKIPHIPYRDAGLPPLPDNAVVRGEDPARPELAINKLVIALSNIDPVLLQKNFNEDRKRLVRAADQLSVLATKSYPVIDNALPLTQDLREVAKEVKHTTKKINRILDDPHFSSDLKETVTKLKETAESIKETVRDINATLSDKPLRRDLLVALDKLSQATENVQMSVDSVQKMSSDTKLRDDIKEILAQARKTLDKVDTMFSRPGYGKDLRSTLATTREAIGNLNMVSRQLNQILDKRAPLLHLMFGRPGKLENQEPDQEQKDKKRKKNNNAPKNDQSEKDQPSVRDSEHKSEAPQQAPDLVVPLDALKPALRPEPGIDPALDTQPLLTPTLQP